MRKFSGNLPSPSELQAGVPNPFGTGLDLTGAYFPGGPPAHRHGHPPPPGAQSKPTLTTSAGEARDAAAQAGPSHRLSTHKPPIPPASFDPTFSPEGTNSTLPASSSYDHDSVFASTLIVGGGYLRQNGPHWDMLAAQAHAQRNSDIEEEESSGPSIAWGTVAGSRVTSMSEAPPPSYLTALQSVHVRSPSEEGTGTFISEAATFHSAAASSGTSLRS